jgi:hypothetical protein
MVAVVLAGGCHSPVVGGTREEEALFYCFIKLTSGTIGHVCKLLPVKQQTSHVSSDKWGPLSETLSIGCKSVICSNCKKISTKVVDFSFQNVKCGIIWYI